MGLYQRRFLQNSFRRCGSQFIGIVFMKNIKNQLYFELLETTIYQWFGRTVRIHNSTTTARRVIIIKDKFHRSQRTSRRFCAEAISEQCIILGLWSAHYNLYWVCASASAFKRRRLFLDFQMSGLNIFHHFKTKEFCGELGIFDDEFVNISGYPDHQRISAQ